MMHNYTDLIEAINRLTDAINQPTNNFITEFISMIIATIGGVLTVLVFELIKNKFITPREEFKKLQRRVNSTLSMQACYYANPAKYNKDTANERMIENYSSAANEIRKIAVEVTAFADERKCQKCCGVPVKNIREAGQHLIGLSNSFFFVGNYPEIERNVELADKVLKLLGIDKEK